MKVCQFPKPSAHILVQWFCITWQMCGPAHHQYPKQDENGIWIGQVNRYFDMNAPETDEVQFTCSRRKWRGQTETNSDDLLPKISFPKIIPWRNAVYSISDMIVTECIVHMGSWRCTMVSRSFRRFYCPSSKSISTRYTTHQLNRLWCLTFFTRWCF